MDPTHNPTGFDAQETVVRVEPLFGPARAFSFLSSAQGWRYSQAPVSLLS
jgi:hypothetical protein